MTPNKHLMKIFILWSLNCRAGRNGLTAWIRIKILNKTVRLVRKMDRSIVGTFRKEFIVVGQFAQFIWCRVLFVTYWYSKRFFSEVFNKHATEMGSLTQMQKDILSRLSRVLAPNDVASSTDLFVYLKTSPAVVRLGCIYFNSIASSFN